VTAQRAAQQLQYVEAPSVDDTADPLERGAQEPAPEDADWVAAYRRASFKRLPRPLRVIGWRLLHAALRIGGNMVYAARSMTDLLACCCHQPQCWPHAQPGQQQPAGQQGGQVQQAGQQQQTEQQHLASQPQQAGRQQEQLQQLWTHLRLLMLESIWVVRCEADGRPFNSGQVVARFRAALQQQLKQDWARTQRDIRVDSGVPMSWLRGRSPVIPPERFVAKWRPAGVLYSVEDDGELRLRLPYFA
jgi:hypothetical protein